MKETTNQGIDKEKKENSFTNRDAILKTFLISSKDINSKNECGWTPLYRTIVAENIEATEELLNIGADPNIRCNMGETALFQAVEMDFLKQAEILLAKGANPNISQNDGRIPLHSAVVKQNLQMVELLLSFGSNTNTQGKLYGQTPVHLAIKNSVKPTILLLLVKNGGSFLIKDKYDKKPTDYVETDEMRDTINMLKLQGEVPETPKKDLLMTPSNLSKKDFILIAKTLSDHKTRKDFENYISSNNNDFHPYNLKIRNLQLDDFLFRENSINKNSNNNINVIEDLRERDNYIQNGYYNNVSNFNTFGNNSSGIKIDKDNDRQTKHKNYLSYDINSDNTSNKENYNEILRQRNASSLNLCAGNNYDYNLIRNSNNLSNCNLNNLSNISGLNNQQENNIFYNHNYSISNFPILSNLNNKVNSPYSNSNKNNVSNSVIPLLNLNNNNNLNFFNNSSNVGTPIHISSDGNIFTKNISVNNSESNNFNMNTHVIPKPEKKETAVNSPSFVKNNGHFERLNSSHNSANFSKNDNNESNKTDSYSIIFNNNENEDKSENKNLSNNNHQNNKNPFTNENKINNYITNNLDDRIEKENVLELDRKISSKSNLSNMDHNNIDNYRAEDLNNSYQSSQNDNNNKYDTDKNIYSKNGNNYYYRSCYLPTIESKGSEFESEYERDLKSQRNSNVIKKYDERIGNYENIVNREFHNTEKEIEDISNVIRMSYEINRNNSNLRELDNVDKCFSEELHRKKIENMILKRNVSDRNRKNQSIHSNPIPEIENDHDNEENTSKKDNKENNNTYKNNANNNYESDNERLREEDLIINNNIEDTIRDYHNYSNKESNNSYNNNHSESNNYENGKSTDNDNRSFNNSKKNYITGDELNFDNNAVFSDTNPLDIINSSNTNIPENTFNFYNEKNTQKYNKMNISENNFNDKNKNINSFNNNYIVKKTNDNINSNKNHSDSIDENEETIGNFNKTNDLSKQKIFSNNSKQIFSKDFYDELNFYGSPQNSNDKKSYVVSELNLTSNRKSRDSIKKIDLSYKMKNEKLDFSNYSQAKNNNTIKNIKNLNLTDVMNSPSNFDNSELNKLDSTHTSNQKTSRSVYDLNEKKNNFQNINKINMDINLMSNNNVQNSRSTNNNSESQITNSYNYKINNYTKNTNSTTSQINLNMQNKENIKLVDVRENLKNYSNSFVDRGPLTIDYTSNRIDFNYNSNNKGSPRYDNERINQSAFIKTNYKYNHLNNSNKNEDNYSHRNNEHQKNNFSKSNLSPNSQKKINYFNTDICDISITKKPRHILDKGIINDYYPLPNTSNNKFKFNQKLFNNDEEENVTIQGNYSSRNVTKEYNVNGSDASASNKIPINKKNSQKSKNRKIVDFPNNISCFEDNSPPQRVYSKHSNNMNSEYLCDDTNITNYNHNFTAYNDNRENEEFNDLNANNKLNNTMNNYYYKNNNPYGFDNSNKKIKSNNNHSYYKDRNNINVSNCLYKINKKDLNQIVSPHSINGTNYNQTVKKINRNLQSDYSCQKNNQFIGIIPNNNGYLETLYQGQENSNLNGTVITSNTISKGDAKKLHNWLMSMNLQTYYNNFIEKGLVNIDHIIYLAANDPENRLSYLDLETIGIRKSGHIYKILTRIEFDAKNIDENLSFLVNYNNFNKNSISNSQINVRMSEAKFMCCGFTKETNNIKNSNIEKPQNLDLIAWLKYVNIPHLRKNFLHNGFDSIEYLILQCFSIYSVDDALLENHIHIYNRLDRKKILSQLAKDLNIINKKICNQSINLNNLDLLSEYENPEKVDPGCKGCLIF